VEYPLNCGRKKHFTTDIVQATLNTITAAIAFSAYRVFISARRANFVTIVFPFPIALVIGQAWTIDARYRPGLLIYFTIKLPISPQLVSQETLRYGTSRTWSTIAITNIHKSEYRKTFGYLMRILEYLLDICMSPLSLLHPRNSSGPRPSEWLQFLSKTRDIAGCREQIGFDRLQENLIKSLLAKE